MYYSRVCYWARAMCPYFSRPAIGEAIVSGPVSINRSNQSNISRNIHCFQGSRRLSFSPDLLPLLPRDHPLVGASPTHASPESRHLPLLPNAWDSPLAHHLVPRLLPPRPRRWPTPALRKLRMTPSSSWPSRSNRPTTPRSVQLLLPLQTAPLRLLLSHPCDLFTTPCCSTRLPPF